MANDYEIYYKEGAGLRFKFPYKPELITAIKRDIPGITWNKEVKMWTLSEGTKYDDDLVKQINAFAKHHRFAINDNATKLLGVSGIQTPVPETNITYQSKDSYQRNKTIHIANTDDKQYIEVTTPYDPRLVDRFHEYTGAKYVKETSKWLIPVSKQEELDSLVSDIRRYFPQTEKPPINTKDDNPMNNIWISKGEGYGGRPYKVGEILRDRSGNIVKVVEAKDKYYNNDGMSFGVGDEKGYVFSARVIPASTEEANTLFQSEQLKRDKVQLTASQEAVKKYIMGNGEYPKGEYNPQGKRIFDTQNLYGGGDWFILNSDYIWYIRNNGADGDDWSHNNIVTGGAGAIGWRINKTSELTNKLNALVEVNELLNKGESLTKDKRDEAFTKLELKSHPLELTAQGNAPPKEIDFAEEYQRHQREVSAPGLRGIPEKGRTSTSNLERIQANRPLTSQIMDVSQSHHVTVSPESPRVKVWVRDQGQMDVEGIDTPNKEKQTKLKAMKPPKFKRPPAPKPKKVGGRRVGPYIYRKGTLRRG